MEILGYKMLIAFGSNENSVQGDVRETLEWAAKRVVALSLSLPSCSRLYTTPAFPAGAGPDFVNAVMQIDTDQPPQAMLSALHAIEQDAHRVR